MQPKFDTGAAENLRRAALWPLLVYGMCKNGFIFPQALWRASIPVLPRWRHYLTHKTSHHRSLWWVVVWCWVRQPIASHLKASHNVSVTRTDIEKKWTSQLQRHIVNSPSNCSTKTRWQHLHFSILVSSQISTCNVCNFFLILSVYVTKFFNQVIKTPF